jgi:hypothetical protein
LKLVACRLEDLGNKSIAFFKISNLRHQIGQLTLQQGHLLKHHTISQLDPWQFLPVASTETIDLQDRQCSIGAQHSGKKDVETIRKRGHPHFNDHGTI